jgi:competence protein ComEC
VAVPATAAAVVLLGVIAGGALVACLSERAARGWIPALAAAALLPWVVGAPATGGWAELHAIDVGQGDAVALRSRRGRWVLVDAGRSWRGGDAGRSTVVPYLRRRGGSLAAVVMTHAHADHVGGLASVVRALHPRVFYDPGFVAPGGPYRAALRAARDVGTRWSRVHPGDSLVVDDVVVTFVAPDSAWTRSLSDPNDASTVVVARVGAVRFLLTGDAERGEEEWMLARGVPLRADVLKVAHHGSATSSTDAWLDAVRPRVALVSVGALNEYGHPSPDRMLALARRGARVLRTDRLGSIALRTDGRRLVVRAEGEEWELPVDSPSS